MPNKKHIRWNQLIAAAKWLGSTIHDHGFDYIYGIPTGGALVAGLIHQLYPDKKIVDEKPNPIMKDEVAIVDDLIDSGSTLRPFMKDGFSCFVAYGKKHSPLTMLKEDPKVIYETDNWLVFPWDKSEDAGPHDAVIRLIEFIGDDPNRVGLVETPNRIVRAYDELFAGYKMNVKDIFKTFDEGRYDQIIICKDIEFYSMCEHHMMPFVGKAHVAYIPSKDGHLLGLSKLARLVDVFAKRLQIQERIGDQVTKSLMEYLKPQGAACIIEAQHFCMCMRGIKKQNSRMITSSMKGVFMDNPAARAELNSLLLL